MARDFGDVFDFGNMTDDEMRDVIVQQLREYPNLDAGWIDIDVQDGFVTLSGSVGTDGEIQVAEKIVAEVLGITDFSNELVVNELHRGHDPAAADVSVMLDAEIEEQLGEPNPNQSDTAEHLVQDTESQAYGTHDVGQAIRDGATYTPPDRPIPDGYGSRENH